MNKILFLFGLILSIGIFLRIYQVTEIPPGINRDEGSIAYTAYSLYMTGKDEYGMSYPLSFQSFGDWKLPLYLYSVVPFVALFGLTEISVRLPSIVLGIATIILTFFLVKQLFKTNTLAILSMGLVAISPWHIHLSRVESESNTAVFLITAGLVLFLKGIQKNQILLIPAFVLFSLTYYTYAGNYIFTTLLVIGLLGIFYKRIVKDAGFYIAIAFFGVLSLIIFSQTVLSANKTKLSGIGIFGDPSVVHAKIEIPRNEHQGYSLFTRLVHNRPIFALERFGQNYLNSFSPDFLFVKGGTNMAHNISNFGNMYLVESLFLLWGFIYLVVRKKSSEEKLVLWWFLIAPIAASITKDAPHTNRMFAIFPILPVITALGAVSFLDYAKQFAFRKIVICIISILFLLNIFLYLDRYFIHFPKNETQNWGFGYKSFLHIVEEKYPGKNIVMTRPEYSPYIFLLFYSGYDPDKFRKEVVRYPITSDGFVHVKSYSRFEFREIDWKKDIQSPNTILVADPLEVPDFIKTDSYKKSYVTLPNGKIMFFIVESL